MQSGRLKELFEPVTEAIEKTETQVGQLVHVHKIAGLPAPLVAGPPGIEGPEEPGGRGGRGCRWITRR